MVDFLTPLISAASGLVGVFLGGWLSNRREAQNRRKEFVTRQLSELYVPLLALISELRARENMRSGLAEAIEGDLPEYFHTDMDIWRKSILPLYSKLLHIFRDKFWLSEPHTRTYYSALVSFTDAWERTFEHSAPGEAIRKLGAHSQTRLLPFYDHVEHTHEALRRAIAA
jgi:hypothetical protein